MPDSTFEQRKTRIPAVAVLAGVAVVLGIGILSYGFWQAWPPLGFIVGGLSISGVGLLLGRGADRRRL